jgi:hypothetical protein
MLVFRHMTPWIFVYRYRRFGRTCCLHLKGKITLIRLYWDGESNGQRRHILKGWSLQSAPLLEPQISLVSSSCLHCKNTNTVQDAADLMVFMAVKILDYDAVWSGRKLQPPYSWYGGRRCPRNVGNHVPHYTVWYLDDDPLNVIFCVVTLWVWNLVCHWGKLQFGGVWGQYWGQYEGIGCLRTVLGTIWGRRVFENSTGDNMRASGVWEQYWGQYEGIGC